MQTALPVALALTFPGGSSENAKVASGMAGLMLDQNRYSVLLPISTMFLLNLVNLTFLGPATTKVMKQRKHQGTFYTANIQGRSTDLVAETRDGKKSYDPGPHSKGMQRLNKRFGALHGASSLVNLIALLTTISYGGTLAEMLE